MALVSAATWREGLNPGVKVRVDQASIDATKSVLHKFLPKYLMIDMGLPKNYNYTYESKLGHWLDWEFAWSDIIYSEIDLDMNDVTFALT